MQIATSTFVSIATLAAATWTALTLRGVIGRVSGDHHRAVRLRSAVHAARLHHGIARWRHQQPDHDGNRCADRHLVDRGERIHPASRAECDGVRRYLSRVLAWPPWPSSCRAPQQVVSDQRTTLTQHIYFLGIGGTLMGSLALLARESGTARQRFRQGAVSADERPARGRRHHRVRRLRSRAAESCTGSRRDRQRRSCRAATPASSTCSSKACRIRPARNGSDGRF